jgi:ABC-type uncharacterized transport system ATPase subunit
MNAGARKVEEPVIRVDDLRKTYVETRAGNRVSFEVRSGTVFVLLGPNGAGKTTTPRAQGRRPLDPADGIDRREHRVARPGASMPKRR